MKKLTKLVIQREKWGAGSLLRNDDRMCCLGHMGKACGASKNKLKDKATLKHLLAPYAPGHFHPTYYKGHIQDLAIDINDARAMPMEEKEERLKTLFKAHGIKLTFEGRTTESEFWGLD